jgi:hypothetical protein
LQLQIFIDEKYVLSAHLLAGLARKEDFPFIAYYCPQCHALNKPKQSAERVSGFNSSMVGSPKTDDGEAVKNASSPAADSVIRSNDPVNASNLEVEEVSEGVNSVGERQKAS